MRGLPDSVRDKFMDAPQPLSSMPMPSQVRQPALGQQLDQLIAQPSLGAGQVGTVLPAQGAGGPQQVSAVPPPAATPSAPVAPAPDSGGQEFYGIDLMTQEIMTISGERLKYPPSVQRDLIKLCLKIALLNRNDALDRLAREYGTSLQEVSDEIRQEVSRAQQSMQGVSDGAPTDGVQENTEVAPPDMPAVPSGPGQPTGA